ncbi:MULTISPECIES: hypothetical protein [unclassified Novosphingobium]|uniref:hypothetical protein n=1 Tax=unclassified Novosphingobium TaxID=2644732 RepID=UPI00135BCDEF|nr:MULTISPECIES: hypothetical protein [unclassified Novosphingobium]
MVLELLNRFGMTESVVAVRSASMHLIRRMVLDGGLLGMIPESQFATELRDGTARQHRRPTAEPAVDRRRL